MSAFPAFPTLLDLSWPVRPGMPMFPGDPPMELRSMGELCTQGYRSHLAVLPAHSGTHIDAPAHVLPEGLLLAELPLARFTGSAVVLDLRARPGLAVTEADLAPHMAALSARTPGFVILRTGDEERFGHAEYYTKGAHLTPGAAEMLAALPRWSAPDTGLSGTGLSGIGLDAASPDPLSAVDLPAHKALLGAGVLVIENLRGLATLPERGFTLLCLPVLGADGSPVRAAALLPGEDA